MSINGNLGFGLNPWLGLIDRAAGWVGGNVATAAASAVSVTGGMNVLPGGNGVQTWQTVTASAAASVAVGPGAVATATATAGGATATAVAGAGGSVFQPAQGVGPQGRPNLALDGLGKILQGLGELLQAFSGCVSHPNPADSGGLKADAASSSVTTSGGYKIEATGKFDWQVTGPDGKVTKIWGDPHVLEGDGGKWDFKKDSTFVLGDGTKIHVKTAPYGGNATVTDALQIEKNGQVVNIDGISQGKGKVGQVRTGPADFKTEQTFVQGKETDDWSFQGKEILGDNGADNFKLGNALAPGFQQPVAAAGAVAQLAQGGLGPVVQQGTQLAQGGGLAQILGQVLNVLQSLIGLLGAGGQAGNNPYLPQPAPQPQPAQTQPAPAPVPAYDPNQHQNGLTSAFNALGSMFVALGQVLQLAGSLPQQPRALNA